MDPSKPNDPVPAIVRAADELATLAAEIKTEYAAYLADMKSGVTRANRLGRLLVQAKADCRHGQWLPWVKENLPFGERQARKYLRIAEKWDELSNRNRDADLGIDAALKLLVKEPGPEPEEGPIGRADSSLDADRAAHDAVPDELRGDCWPAADLPGEVRHALRGGLISPAAAADLRRLHLYDKVATAPTDCHCHQSWWDHQAKLILYRPRFARTDERVRYEVDSALFDLWMIRDRYANLPADEADRLAVQNTKHLALNRDGLCEPQYWWGELWLRMRPDFGHLDEGEWALVCEAALRYVQTDPEDDTPQNDTPKTTGEDFDEGAYGLHDRPGTRAEEEGDWGPDWEVEGGAK
jgi:hypothetical protein